MQVTKEYLEAEKNKLSTEFQQIQINSVAIQGAIKQIDLILAYLDTEDKI